MDSKLQKLGIFAANYRWQLIAIWAILLILSLPLAPKAPSVLKAGFGAANTEAARAVDILETELGRPKSLLVIAFSSNKILTTDHRFIEDMSNTLSGIEHLTEVKNVITFFDANYNVSNPHLISKSKSTTYALVHLDTSFEESQDLVPEIRNLLHPTILDVWVTGDVAIFADLDVAVVEDMRRSEYFIIPVLLIILVFVFGSLVAAIIPLAMGILSISITMAIIYLIGRQTDMSIFVLNIATVLGLGIAIDYSLIILSRFREELLINTNSTKAIAVTLSTAGKAVFFSALTSAVGLSGLLIFQFMALRSMGVGGIVVVVISMMVALTILPAVLVILGDKVNKFPIISGGRLTKGIWNLITNTVIRHPFPVAIPIVALLIMLGLPFLQVNLGAPWFTALPSDSESREGWELLIDEFGETELSPIIIVLTSESPFTNPDTVSQIATFVRKIENDTRVSRVDSFLSVDQIGSSNTDLENSPGIEVTSRDFQELIASLPSANSTMITVYPTTAPLDDQTKGLITDLRQIDPGPNTTVLITGTTAALMDYIALMYRDFPKVIIFVLATLYVVLFWLFRSVILPFKAVLMNSMSIFASYGALVFIFQQGHLQNLLGFTALGYTDAVIPILLFCVTFGLSMDYELFLLTRIKEVYSKTQNNSQSVAEGLQKSGKVITGGSLILIVASGSFVLGDVVITKSLGLGIAVAIFIDATIVRALLVPALMKILGDWNWWCPAFIRRESKEDGHS